MSTISLDPKIEKRLIEASKKDKKNFSPIYAHYKNHIYKFFFVRTNDETLSDELTSIVFEKALKGLSNFQWQGISFSAWLYRIARNTLIDYFRGNEKRQKAVSIDTHLHLPSLEKTPHEQMEIIFSEDLLYKILNELPIKEREIIYMKFFDGYTNRIIAKVTGLSETNVGTIIYRTLKKLKKEYTDITDPHIQ